MQYQREDYYNRFYATALDITSVVLPLWQYLCAITSYRCDITAVILRLMLLPL